MGKLTLSEREDRYINRRAKKYGIDQNALSPYDLWLLKLCFSNMVRVVEIKTEIKNLKQAIKDGKEFTTETL